jgi:hypothetical protein
MLAGAALSAQLEAVRAGFAEPRSTRKVVESEPRGGAAEAVPTVRQAS